MTTHYDIYFVGVGGQGVLTIGEIITLTAFRKSLPVNFYPTKGMAQRGGFVKAQLRLGRAAAGPSIPEKGADLVIATEISELLKAVRYIKPGGDVLLYGYQWSPTAVMLGKAPYPKLEQVREQVTAAGGKWHYVAPDSVPMFQNAPAPDNIYLLATALAQTPLGEILPPAEVAQVVRERWNKGIERNLFAFEAGLKAESRAPVAAPTAAPMAA
jgi:indolepyruvate ferredoxin oxidoreductase, beta subunit